MSVGSIVRAVLGPLESCAADLYRDFFIDLNELARTLACLKPVERILEVGCGGGQLANHIAGIYPEAQYLGIDPMGEPGTLFRGDRGRASFRSARVDQLPREETFDLALLVDVVHHVPPSEREGLLRETHGRLRPGGFLVVKEWERRRNFAHLACYVSDRYISGTPVWFPSRDEILGLLSRLPESPGLFLEARIPPRRNNLLVVQRKATGPA